MDMAKFPPDSELVAFITRKPRGSDTPLTSRTFAQMAGMDLVNFSPDNTPVTCCHRQDFDYVIKCWDIATGGLAIDCQILAGQQTHGFLLASTDNI